MERMKATHLTIEFLNKDTGEILKLDCVPEDLMTVMRTVQTLNTDGLFEIHNIYSYGTLQKMRPVEVIKCEWR